MRPTWWLYLVYYPILRPLYYALGIYRIYIETPGEFRFLGRSYRYFQHWHGMTYLIERTVEVSVIREVLNGSEGKTALELGNCMSFFQAISHDVVDKYDRKAGVHHVDIVDYRPSKLYDTIISISTIEHIGWDEVPVDPRKTLVAFDHLIDLLAPGGEMWITWALGYNPHIDQHFWNGRFRFTEVGFLVRRTHYSNLWSEGTVDEARSARYGAPFRSGNAIVVGCVRKDAQGRIVASAEDSIARAISGTDSARATSAAAR